jgi:hypothetical protein
VSRGLFFAALALAVAGCPSKPGSGITEQATQVSAADDGDPIWVGAGDIAVCAWHLPWISPYTDGEPTAKLLDSLFANHAHSNGVVFTLGDNAYPGGSVEDFKCYQRTWGRHKARTRPAIGNHEYVTLDAAGYFSYFGAAGGNSDAGGYYSYDLGSWHLVALDSPLAISTQPEFAERARAQEKWLEKDLTEHRTKCAAAYWHHPRFSSAKHGSEPRMSRIWEILYHHGVDVALSGHDHVYERFAPQNPAGAADWERGIRQFTVGTGGSVLYDFKAALPNSEVRYNGGHGVLKMTLHPASYDWQFISEDGKTFSDSGNASCH